MTTIFEHRTFEAETVVVQVDHKYHACKFERCTVLVPSLAALVERFGEIDPLSSVFPGEIFDSHCEFKGSTIVHRPPPNYKPDVTPWAERVEQAKANGASVIAPNEFPITVMTANNKLLECEHGDHPDYKYPVEVVYTEERTSEFERADLSAAHPPAHLDHAAEIDWDRRTHAAYCNKCKRMLTDSEYVHINVWTTASMEDSSFAAHVEALVWNDHQLALTLHETCPTIWRRDGGGYVSGPEWSKKWRLSDAALDKIWPGTTTEKAWDLCPRCFERCCGPRAKSPTKIEEKSVMIDTLDLQWECGLCGWECDLREFHAPSPHRVIASWIDLRNRYNGRI